MTLGEFFTICDQNPSIVLFYFMAMPLSASLALVFGKGQGHVSPWKYLYTALIYLAMVPGLFALTLSIYLYVIQGASIMSMNIFTQLLPIASMVLTVWIINRNVSLDHVPGFDRLSGLIMLILAVLILMWILDRTRLIAFTYIPIIYVLLIMVAVLLLARYGLGKMSSRRPEQD